MHWFFQFSLMFWSIYPMAFQYSIRLFGAHLKPSLCKRHHGFIIVQVTRAKDRLPTWFTETTACSIPHSFIKFSHSLLVGQSELLCTATAHLGSIRILQFFFFYYAIGSAHEYTWVFYSVYKLITIFMTFATDYYGTCFSLGFIGQCCILIKIFSACQTLECLKILSYISHKHGLCICE